MTAAQQKTKPDQPGQVMTALLKVPPGARSVVVNLDGETQTEAVLGGVTVLPLRVRVTPHGVAYSYRMHSGFSSTEVTGSTGNRIEFKPFTQAKRDFTPALNTWLEVWSGMSKGDIHIALGPRSRDFGQHQMRLQVLLTDKPAERISKDIQPPQKP